MNMSNLDEPIIPTHEQVMDGYEALSVRQYACIKMADSGCAELDAIIEKGNKQRLAGLAMQALVTHHGDDGDGACNPLADKYADALLQQLKGDV